jgi:hypothetical protein
VSSRGLHEATVEELLSIYAKAAAAQGRASSDGDDKAANAQYDVLSAAYQELRRRGSETQRALLGLLEHPDPAVQLWAAADALEFSPADGERTLDALVAAGGLVGFDAEMTLETRRQGKLRFP